MNARDCKNEILLLSLSIMLAANIETLEHIGSKVQARFYALSALTEGNRFKNEVASIEQLMDEYQKLHFKIYQRTTFLLRKGWRRNLRSAA